MVRQFYIILRGFCDFLREEEASESHYRIQFVAMVMSSVDRLDLNTFEFSFKKMCPLLVDKSSGTRFNWSRKHNQDRNISRDF